MKVLLSLLKIYLFFQKRDDLSINCEDNVISKNILSVGNFNISLLHFEQNKKVQHFY